MRPSAVARVLVAAVAATAVASVVVLTDPIDRSAQLPATGVSGVAEQGRAVPDREVTDGARERAVGELLDSWAEAVRTDDATALRGLIDPAADPGLLPAELRRADNLAGVPLADWGYRISEEAALVVDPALVSRLGADEVWAPPVSLRYALAGVDDVATVKPVGLVVARRGEQWRLVSDTALDDRGRQTWRGPWDFDPVISRSAPQGVVLGHPGQEAQLDALLAELVSGVPAVSDFWGPVWPQRAAVVLAASQAELSALVGPGFDGAAVAAVTTADAVDVRGGTAVGVRVVFNPVALPRLTPQTLRIVLRHELTHVAARTVTADEAPLWALEGFADYVGYRDSGLRLSQGAPEVAAQVAAGGPPDALPTDADFRSTTGSELAYQLSWTFAVYLAETRGEDTLRAVYGAVAAAATPTPAHLDAVLRASVGADLAALVDGWRAWLPRQLF